MQKIIFRIFLFILLPAAAVVYILLTDLDREYAWKSIPGDCENRGSWIYDRMIKDEKAIDIAFLGTSHTINGIRDTLISNLITKKTGKTITALNLGYCRFGNELQFIIAKDLFTHKKVKTIVIEINETFGISSHPVYSYYAQTEDIIHPASFKNQKALVNIYDAFLARLSQLRTDFFNTRSLEENTFPEYGYRGYAGFADPQKLIEPAVNLSADSNPIRQFNIGYPESWIKALVDLCKANNSQVYFLYIPSYSSQPVPIEGMEFYNSLAPVLVMPRTELTDKKLWRDADHLNDKGAAIFSTWIGNELSKGK